MSGPVEAADQRGTPPSSGTHASAAHLRVSALPESVMPTAVVPASVLPVQQRRPTATPLPAHRRNFRFLAGEGIASNLSYQLTAAGVVLPFICIALGGSPLLAAMILPFNTMAGIVGTALAPPLLARRRSNTAALAGLVGLTGLITVGNALGSELVPDAMAFGFLLTGAALGIVGGVTSVCFVDVAAASLHPSYQSRLPILKSTIAAVLVLIVTASDYIFFARPDGPASHIGLLWVGSAALFVAAICCLFITPISPATLTRVTVLRSLELGMMMLRRMQWFRRYLVVQVLFLSVTLGTSFYSAHGASVNGSQHGSLHIIVACTSIGLVVFSTVWSRVRRFAELRYMYLAAGVLSTLAGILCVVVNVVPNSTATPWIFGVVLALSAMAALAVSSSKQFWLMRSLTVNRLAVIGFSQLVTAVATTLAALGLGVLSHLQGVIWPVYCVVGIDLLAMAAIRWVPALALDGRPR
jgi:hypothetical protein